MQRVFKIHSCIGKGGFGEVYVASMFVDGREQPHSTALKILHADLDPASHAVERLRDESRMLAVLDHPNILKAERLAVIDGRVALVTEFIAGLDLSTLAGGHPLPSGPALEIVEAVADALHDAQTHEVDGTPLDLIHRDIKPENIRIGYEGEIRLLDFGVARTETLEREAVTDNDVVMGSLPYLASEVLTNAKSEHASDVYALGATLFYAIQGERLFKERGPELFGLLLHNERFDKRIDERISEIEDRDVANLVRAMVAYDAEQRPLHAEIRDRARSLRNGRVPDLKTFCARQRWPAPRSLPGVLSGRVFAEDDVDPATIDPVESAGPARTPENQPMTQMSELDSDLYEGPTEPAGSEMMEQLRREFGTPTPPPSAQRSSHTSGLPGHTPAGISQNNETYRDTGPSSPQRTAERSPASMPNTQAGPSRGQLAMAVGGIGLAFVIVFVLTVGIAMMVLQM